MNKDIIYALIEDCDTIHESNFIIASHMLDKVYEYLFETIELAIDDNCVPTITITYNNKTTRVLNKNEFLGYINILKDNKYNIDNITKVSCKFYNKINKSYYFLKYSISKYKIYFDKGE